MRPGRRLTLAFVVAFTASFPVLAAEDTGAGIDVVIRIDRMVEDYTRTRAPLSYAVSRMQFHHVLSASGTGMIATRQFSASEDEVDQRFAPGEEPRGFHITKGRNGQPLFRIRAVGLPRETVVEGRFLRGDWADLEAGRRVSMAVSVHKLDRAQGAAERVGEAVTAQLRGKLESAIPFVKVRVGEMTRKRLRLWGEEVVLTGNRHELVAEYPTAEMTYGAPVTLGR
jgi:hypothetical protein